MTIIEALEKSTLPRAEEIQSMIKVLGRCTANDVELLKFQFYEKREQQLFEIIEKRLERAACDTRIVLTGLALGPVAFDSWLLKAVLPIVSSC